MIKEPLFQPNIWETLIRNFAYFFFEKNWPFYAAFFILVFCLVFLLLLRKSAVSYAGVFPAGEYRFNAKERADRLGLYFCLLVLGLYAAVMFLLENSLFNNHDLMSYNTTLSFLKGQISGYDADRFTPLAFWDNNIVYAVTHNFYLIDVYLLAKQALIAFLLYRFLVFVPVGRRLFGIGVVLFLPALFWINNMIFPEQNMLIFILASLIAVKNYSFSGKKSSLAWFVFFMNLAIYTKESAILFYSGILITSVLYDVFIEKINLSSFIHPLQTVKQMPLEFLMFFSMLVFSTFYLLTTESSENNRYIAIGRSQISELLPLYKIELSLALVALIVFVRRVWKKKIQSNPMFNEGLLLGSLMVIGVIVFYFRLHPISTHVYFKSYYLVLSAVFLSVYLLINVQKSKEILFGGILLVMVSGWVNYDNFNREQGVWYRETAEFLVSNSHNEETLNIYLAPHIEYNLWTVEAWSSALRYYFPNINMVFKSNMISEDAAKIYARVKPLYHPLIGQEEPIPGDYYVVKKNYYWGQDLAFIARKKSLKVYENEAFQVFKILP